MRIAIDAHTLGRHLTGNEVYVRSLLSSFAAQSYGHEILAYVSGDLAWRHVPEGIAIRHIATNPFLRLGFDLASRVRQDQPDVLHVQYTAPIGCRVPVVATVHDVSYLEHPEYFTPQRRLQLRITVGRTVRRAARILTGTEAARQAILKVYPQLSEEKVVVAPLAPSPEFRPVSRNVAAAAVAERYGLRGPFLLSVGDLQPRKNQIGLIRAFASLVTAHPQIRHDLWIVGKPTWYAPQVYQAARESGVADRIHFPGFVPDTDLLHFYNACDCFVFPSFYEGFGLPPLEAMACGRAVVCSDASALPEVVDGAAVLFDPYTTGEIARALADVLLDAEFRTRLERLGLQRAAHFSWQKTAQKTLEALQDAAGSRPTLMPASPATVSRESRRSHPTLPY